MGAPPWLRFQAYVVGLPKTGSTSLATAFGAYRTGHEVSRRELVAAGLHWQAGRLSPDEFWDVTTPRLTKPSLELDSATCHHLYAPLLAQRFPGAVFIHTVRDVGSWISSLLDMLLRGRYVREIFLMLSSEAETQYMEEMLGGRLDAWFDPMAGDRAAVVPLMQYWSRHMREMATVLPDGRTKVVRTAEIGRSLPVLADLCGVSAGTLRGDLSHANRAADRLNRFALHGDDELRDAYEMYCADIMAELSHRSMRPPSGTRPPGGTGRRTARPCGRRYTRSTTRGAEVVPARVHPGRIREAHNFGVGCRNRRLE